MRGYQITNQKDLRRSFWETRSEGKRGAKNRFGEYSTDTRVAWCDYIDSLCRDGVISEDLAQRATLEGR
jgi:hypothetical protein